MVPEESYSPFWKNCGKRLGAFDPNPVAVEIEVSQRAVDKQMAGRAVDVCQFLFGH